MTKPKPLLLTPGPTNVPPRVLEALARPIPHHRSAEFEALFRDCHKRLRHVFRTKHAVASFAGSGTLAMEAAMTGVHSPGEKVITLETGKFGERWTKIARAFGVEAAPLRCEWGEAIAPERVAAALAEHPDARAVCATLCETSTAVLNDIEAIGRIVAPTEALFIVDAISGLAADRLECDAWGVDIAVAGSQKALMLPPGLAFATVSAKARERMERARCPTFYASLRAALDGAAKDQSPFTPAVSLFEGLRVAIDMILEEGIENVWARHRRLADGLRAGGRALGLPVFSKAPSNAVVAFKLPEGVAYAALRDVLRDRFGVTIAGGQDHLKGRIIRLAALGWADEKDILQSLGALEEALIAVGGRVETPGVGVAAALEAWRG
jgi:aspartate aminotransferase-like enzyme